MVKNLGFHTKQLFGLALCKLSRIIYCLLIHSLTHSLTHPSTHACWVSLIMCCSQGSEQSGRGCSPIQLTFCTGGQLISSVKELSSHNALLDCGILYLPYDFDDGGCLPRREQRQCPSRIPDLLLDWQGFIKLSLSWHLLSLTVVKIILLPNY